MNSIIYNLQLGFRQKYSTAHALIHLTEKKRERVGSGNFDHGIFFDLQKTFATVGDDILIQKLNHYVIRGVANNWFSSYLQTQLQYVSINSFSSNLEHIHCEAFQGSILGLQ